MVAPASTTRTARDPAIREIEEIINYHFRRPNLLLEACMRPGSYQAFPEGNRRLAIVGDGALDHVLSKDWEARTVASPMVWDRDIRRALTCNANLARIAQEKRLIYYLPITMPTDPTRISIVRKATLVEAIVGAADQDGGVKAAQKVMIALGIEFSIDDVNATRGRTAARR